MIRKLFVLGTATLLALTLAATGCWTPTSNQPDKTTIVVAAAMSLRNCMENDLKALFQDNNPDVEVKFTFDSSGKLQRQIEEGADIDVFFSAAEKEMNALVDAGLISDGTVTDLLENKIVLIIPKSTEAAIARFEDILQVEVIAIGDPEIVPAGRYAKEAFVSLGIWDAVQQKASLGSNVAEVLSWVAESSADAGVVYSTDAASNKNVKVVAEAPEGSVSRIVYPVGILKSSANREAADLFVDFLKSPGASEAFARYGFSPNY